MAIKEVLKQKTAKEKLDIKSSEIVRLLKKKKYVFDTKDKKWK